MRSVGLSFLLRVASVQFFVFCTSLTYSTVAAQDAQVRTGTERTTLPAAIQKQLPNGYNVLTFKTGDLNGDRREDYAIVLRRPEEEERYHQMGEGSPRPLLVFMQAHRNAFILSARNDGVVYRIDQGGQCDPFLDGSDGLSVHGPTVTIRNAVACGNHWEDRIRFRYSASKHTLLFDKRVYESWVFNPSTDPNAEALIPGVRKITRSSRTKPTTLDAFVP